MLRLGCFACRNRVRTTPHAYGHRVQVGHGSLNSDMAISAIWARGYEEDDEEERRGRRRSKGQVWDI